MFYLTRAINAFGTADFENALKSELESLPVDSLPLQEGLSLGSHVGGAGFSVMVLNVQDTGLMLSARIGICYSGIIAGCACSDDPTPMDEHSEYCEASLEIDKITALAKVTLIV